MKKAILINLGVLVGTSFAQVGLNQQVASYQIDARYQPENGLFLYKTLDSQGRVVDSNEQFFAVPPIQECTTTTWSDLALSLRSMNINPSWSLGAVDVSQQLQCCDYYISGQGYLFTRCDAGAGTYILSSKKGDQRSQFYMSQNLTQMAPFNANWSTLIGMVDQFCGQTATTPQVQVQVIPQQPIQPQPQQNQANLIFVQTNLPWLQWFQTWQITPQNMQQWTLNDWRTWLTNYGLFLQNQQQIQQNTNTGGGLRRMLQQNLEQATTVTTVGAADQGVTELPGEDSTTVTTVGGANDTTIGDNTTTVTTVGNQTQVGDDSTTVTTVSGEPVAQQPGQGLGQQAAIVIWLPNYDGLTINQVQTDLQSRGILQPFMDWYNLYWGVNGLAVQFFTAAQNNTTTIPIPNTGFQQVPTVVVVPQQQQQQFDINNLVFTGDIGTIPQGMEQIVGWINLQVSEMLNTVNIPLHANIAVQDQLYRQNQQQQTRLIQQQQEESRLVRPLLFPRAGYQIPLSCQSYPTATRSDVFCCRNQNNDDNVCYSLLTVNTFYQNYMTQLCGRLENLFNFCPFGDISCAQFDMYTWFDRLGYKLVYGQIYFDPLAQRSIYSACQASGYQIPLNFDQFRYVWWNNFGFIGGP